MNQWPAARVPIDWFYREILEETADRPTAHGIPLHFINSNPRIEPGSASGHLLALSPYYFLLSNSGKRIIDNHVYALEDAAESERVPLSALVDVYGTCCRFAGSFGTALAICKLNLSSKILRYESFDT